MFTTNMHMCTTGCMRPLAYSWYVSKNLLRAHKIYKKYCAWLVCARLQLYTNPSCAQTPFLHAASLIKLLWVCKVSILIEHVSTPVCRKLKFSVSVQNRVACVKFLLKICFEFRNPVQFTYCIVSLHPLPLVVLTKLLLIMFNHVCPSWQI